MGLLPRRGEGTTGTGGKEWDLGRGWPSPHPAPGAVLPGAPSSPGWLKAASRRTVLGFALPGSGPTAEAALPSAVQTDPPASAPTPKPSASSPPRDALTPGPGPSSAALPRQPPAKAPATDSISECAGMWGCRAVLRVVVWGWGEGTGVRMLSPTSRGGGLFCST